MRSAKSETRGKRSADVCAGLGIQPYVLKFWEGEFPQLGRRLGSSRLYGATELRIVGEIKELVEVRGMTLAEARRVLAERWPEGADAPAATVESTPAERDQSSEPAVRETAPVASATASAAKIRALEDRIERLQDDLRRLRTAETDRERLQREVERLRSVLVGTSDAELRGDEATPASEEAPPRPLAADDLASEVGVCLEEARRLSAEIDALLVALAPVADGSASKGRDRKTAPQASRGTPHPGPRTGRGKSGP